MQTSVVGFPRIGENREWKKSLESYWSKELSVHDLFEMSQKLQTKHFFLMEKLSSIPLDFAFYDHVLETAWTVGIVPRYLKESSLSLLDQYFALARGYQNSHTDIKAWPMKKWFTTNYHYVVPKISQETSWEVDFSFLNARLYAQKNSSPHRPVLVGPYTLFMLSQKDGLSSDRTLDHLLSNYQKTLEYLISQGYSLIQLDEPALVMDMTKEEKTLFSTVYQYLLQGEKKIPILLQTYFGDIRDIYTEVMSLPIKAVGLDFVEGSRTLSLIKTEGFSPEKHLFAGIIPGRSVWKTDYKASLSLLSTLLRIVPEDMFTLSTSCSLLHLPYTIKKETHLPPEVQNALSFACEKLAEIQEIARLFSSTHPSHDPSFLENQKALLDFRQIPRNPALKEKLENLHSQDFQREKSVEERLPLQRNSLQLGLLPTTTIGSFPQTPTLRKLRKDYNENRISSKEYTSAIKEMIRNCIKEQEEIGLDVLVHGEFERNDMVEYFASFLSGFATTKNGWVQSYGSRTTKPPLLYGDIVRLQPMTVEWISYAQSLTQKHVKAILTGPITIINWSFCREDIPLREIAYQLALALREEIEELQNIGIKIVQVDEAALREKLPLRKEEWESYLSVATSAFRLATSILRPEVQLHTHMCYSEFAEITDAIEALDADVLTIEASRSELSVIQALKNYSQKRDIGPGVYDIHSPRIPPIEELQITIETLLQVIPAHHLWINPDCGLKTRKPQEAIESLKNMVTAAKKIQKSLF